MGVNPTADPVAAPRRGTARAGFSLVSVVIAVALLTVGLLALARSQTLLSRTEGTSTMRNRASAIARSHMELLRSEPPASVTTESAVAVDSLGRAVAGGSFRRSVTVTNESTNLIRVLVQVTYPRGATPAEISTLIFR